MQFLNRDKEKAILSAEFERLDSRLVVLYGRRRIGKSALLQQLMDAFCSYYLADINEAELQRGLFSQQISMHIPGFDDMIYPDWYSFFRQINRMLKGRITIVIDEFPNLVKSSPELPSVLQKIIDLKENSMFHLVLCGSSQQMMQGLVLDVAAALFGRAHRIIRLLPMECGWLQKALSLDPVSTIEEYSVWGGIPRYWELRSDYQTLWKAVEELILDPYGVLHEEPQRLFLDDLKNAVQPVSIASLIGMGCNKLSEIAGRLNRPGTNLNRAMQNMIDTGYIKRDVCWGESIKNSKKTLYRLIDPLSRFYFTFVVPNQSKLNSGMMELVQEEIKEKWRIYVSETWEELCRQSVSRLKIDGTSFLPAQRWWQQSKRYGSAEIDIIAESTDGRCLLVGEAKWKEQTNAEKALQELERKFAVLDLKKKYRKIYRLIMLPDIKLRTEDDILFRNAAFVCEK